MSQADEDARTLSPMTDFAYHIGAAIHVVRVMRELTQVELASSVCSLGDADNALKLQGYISKVENGKIAISWHRLGLFCQVLRMQPSELIAIAEDHRQNCLEPSDVTLGKIKRVARSQLSELSGNRAELKATRLKGAARRVHGKLKSLIVSEGFESGYMWSVEVIAKRFRCRNRTVRTAVARLRAEGLVSTFGQNRFAKLGYDSDYIKCLIRERMVLEYEVLRSLCSSDIKQSLKPLRAIHDKMSSLDCTSEDGLMEFLESDIDFHDTLFRLAGFDQQADEATEMTQHIVVGVGTLAFDERPDQVIEEHDRIIEAIKAQSHQEAFEALRDHLIAGTLNWKKSLAEKLNMYLPRSQGELLKLTKEIEVLSKS